MNILVTNYKGTGDNVLVLLDESLNLSSLTLATALAARKIAFDDVYCIEDEQMQYYIYEPLFADRKFVESVKKIASENRRLKDAVMSRIGQCV